MTKTQGARKTNKAQVLRLNNTIVFEKSLLLEEYGNIHDLFLAPCALHLVPYPKSILVLSPIFSDLVSPRRFVSLPITDVSKTISKRLEKEPMMEFFTME